MSLIAELKRRNVFRVGVAYAIVAWLLVEVASVVLPTFEAPEWVMKVLTFLVILGFPLALILAWAFELTPEGIKREETVDRAESIRHQTGRKLDFAIIGLLVIAVVYFAVDKFVLDAQPEVVAEQASGPESVAREKSIAVLPFENLSQDATNEPFTIGIHDDILTQISKISALKVISRTSVMEYRNTTKNLKTIGQELGAATVLEGGVQRAGDRVRINVQLIDAVTDKHLWADTYDRRLTAENIFAIQTEIATAIADALRATLSPEEQNRLATVPTENLAAYEAYILGKQRMAKFTSVALEEAAEYFEQAVNLDPGFALAYVGLADAHVQNANLLGIPENEKLVEAEVLIQRALELDDQLGEAYAVLAWIQNRKNDLEDAQENYRRALELDPNSARTYSGYADLMNDLRRLEESLTLRRKAVELDPLSAVMIQRVGWGLAALGRFDEALSWYEKSFDVDPGFSWNLWNIGAHHWLISGQYGEAIRWLRKASSSDSGDPFNPASLGRLFLDLGDSDQAEYWIHRSIEAHPESVVSNNAMLLLHLYQGDEAAGLEYGRKSFAIDKNDVEGVIAVELLGDHEIRAGRYSKARDLYAERFPEWLREDDLKINDGNRSYRAAINLALILSNTGEQDRADLLLNRSLQYIETHPRLSWDGYGIADVKIYALRGEKQKALSTLRQAIDEGWRSLWWYLLKQDPSLESLHDEPEFQAMVAEIEADMAEQLARVREMERSGELEPIPELAAE
jgi:TolB-like protein/Tfp pilus assembly protein PilF